MCRGMESGWELGAWRVGGNYHFIAHPTPPFPSLRPSLHLSLRLSPRLSLRSSLSLSLHLDFYLLMQDYVSVRGGRVWASGGPGSCTSRGGQRLGVRHVPVWGWLCTSTVCVWGGGVGGGG